MNTNIKISIVIAAKNEEENISVLLSYLSDQSYDKSNFEIIIVNDNSTDNTLNKIKKSINDIPGLDISVIETTMPGKRNALSTGIEKSKFPFICITDADCRPQKNWLNSFSEKFGEGNDFVFGVAPFIQEKNIVNKISCFENFRSSLLAVAMAKAGFPYSAAARSFGFSKKAFEKIEGYKNTFDTLSGDDDLLLREAVKHKMKIGIVNEKDAFVFSKTKSRFKEYFRQRSRHTKSSFYYLPKQQFILAVYHLLNLFFLFSPALMFADKFFLLPLLVKFTLDFIITKTYQEKFGYKFSFFEIFYLQIIYELLLIVHFLNALFRKEKWK